MEYYTDLLGSRHENKAHASSNLIKTEDQKVMLEAQFTVRDVKKALYVGQKGLRILDQMTMKTNSLRIARIQWDLI